MNEIVSNVNKQTLQIAQHEIVLYAFFAESRGGSNSCTNLLKNKQIRLILLNYSIHNKNRAHKNILQKKTNFKGLKVISKPYI